MFRSAVRYLQVQARGRPPRRRARPARRLRAEGRISARCEHLEPHGLGALQLAFEQLKKKLQAEGLFDAVPQAAAARAAAQDRDRHVARRRGAARHHQGPAAPAPERAPRDSAGARAGRKAAAEVVARAPRDRQGRRRRRRHSGRGGGSIEDLWAFNEESRRARDRRVPRSGDLRGRPRDRRHDRRLRRRPPRADAVGGRGARGRGEGRVLSIASIDCRIGSQTAARGGIAAAPRRRARAGQPARTRRAGPRASALRGRHAAELTFRLRRALTTALQQQERALQALRRRLEARDLTRRLAVIRGRLQAADAQLSATVQRRTDRGAAALRALAGRLDSLSPLAVLGRGYAVCWNDERTAILRDAVAARRPATASRSRSREARLSCEVRGTLEPWNRWNLDWNPEP